MKIEREVIETLKTATRLPNAAGVAITLPHLAANLYSRCREVLEQAGLPWSARAGAHVGSQAALDRLDAALHSGRITHARRDLHRFESSPTIADEVAAELRDDALPSDRPLRVLEPSAGSGELIRAIYDQRPDAQVTAVEIDAEMCRQLAQRFPLATVICADFGEWATRAMEPFDAIIANPPFNAAAEHLDLMISLLATSCRSRLSIILPKRDTTRYDPVDDLLRSIDADRAPLPDRSFIAAGTAVPTIHAIGYGFPSVMQLIRRIPEIVPDLETLCHLSYIAHDAAIAACSGPAAWKRPTAGPFAGLSPDDVQDKVAELVLPIGTRLGRRIEAHLDPRSCTGLQIRNDSWPMNIPPIARAGQLRWLTTLTEPSRVRHAAPARPAVAPPREPAPPAPAEIAAAADLAAPQYDMFATA